MKIIKIRRVDIPYFEKLTPAELNKEIFFLPEQGKF